MNTNKKRALLIANLDNFHKNFNIPYVNRLKNLNYEVELTSSGDSDFKDIAKKYNINFARSPFDLKNIKEFIKLRKIIKSHYYDLIYLSTPVVGAYGRLATLFLPKGRVVYSAHGFNFYKGNKRILNFLYSRIERMLSRITDCLFTMNAEDYEACFIYKMRSKEIYNVDGVGIDLSRFSKVSADKKHNLRSLFGYDDDIFILIYPAEFNNRKNQELLLKTVVILKNKYPTIKLVLPGDGLLQNNCITIAKELGIENNVDFLGYRNDVDQLLQLSDVLFASSKNEGLPINMIEALSCGLPVVATRTRGHVDLINEGINGFLFDIENPSEAADKITMLLENQNLYKQMSENAEKSAKKYDINNVIHQYDKVFGLVSESETK